MVFRVKMQKSFHYNAKLNFQMLLSNSLWKLKNLGNYQMMKILKTKIMAIFIDTGQSRGQVWVLGAKCLRAQNMSTIECRAESELDQGSSSPSKASST